MCTRPRVELVQGCWEGHLNGRQLAHLFSVWSTTPRCAARSYRCQSAYRLLALMAVRSSASRSSWRPGVVRLAARLLQFLSHAGTKIRANIKPQIRWSWEAAGTFFPWKVAFTSLSSKKETLVWAQLVAFQSELWRPPCLENITLQQWHIGYVFPVPWWGSVLLNEVVPVNCERKQVSGP